MKTIEVNDREARILEELAKANDTDVAEIIELLLEFEDDLKDRYDLL